MNTETRPAFREPWKNGAHAYFEADTFEAAKEGFKRKRKSLIFHMPNPSEASELPCILCGGKLGEPALSATRDMGNDTRLESPASTTVDRNSTWHYDARRKVVRGGMHYACSWGDLLGRISAIREI